MKFILIFNIKLNKDFVEKNYILILKNYYLFQIKIQIIIKKIINNNVIYIGQVKNNKNEEIIYLLINYSFDYYLNDKKADIINYK